MSFQNCPEQYRQSHLLACVMMEKYGVVLLTGMIVPGTAHQLRYGEELSWACK